MALSEIDYSKLTYEGRKELRRKLDENKRARLVRIHDPSPDPTHRDRLLTQRGRADYLQRINNNENKCTECGQVSSKFSSFHLRHKDGCKALS